MIKFLLQFPTCLVVIHGLAAYGFDIFGQLVIGYVILASSSSAQTMKVNKK